MNVALPTRLMHRGQTMSVKLIVRNEFPNTVEYINIYHHNEIKIFSAQRMKFNQRYNEMKQFGNNFLFFFYQFIFLLFYFFLNLFFKKNKKIIIIKNIRKYNTFKSERKYIFTI